MKKSRFVVSITIKKTELLTDFWQNKLSKLEDSYYKLGYELREFDNDRIQFKRRIREFDQGDTDRLRAQHQQL